MVNYSENAIKEAAYYIWQNAGCPQGQDEWCWSVATEQLCNCKSSSNSSCKASASKASASTTKKTTSSKSAACKSTSTAKKSAK